MLNFFSSHETTICRLRVVSVSSLCRAFQGSLCVWFWVREIKVAQLRLREHFGKAMEGFHVTEQAGKSEE